MPERQQVQDLYKDRGYSPKITPVASPVDTFVSPNKITNPNAQVLELINAFQDIQPGLSKFAQQRIDKSNEIDVEAGKKAALENKAQFKEAVNQGVIPAGASPWFRVGWERQKATRSSLEYDQALKEAYAQTNLADSDDPKAVSAWMAQFTSEWTKANPEAQSNPEFQSIFNVIGAKSQDALQSQHAAIRTKKVEEELVQDTDFMLGATLDKSITIGGERSPTLGEELATLVGEQVANGLNGQMANRMVTDAVIRKAVQEGDITVLDVLDEVPSGSGTVGQISYVKDAVAQARDQIATKQTHQAKFENLKMQEQRKAAIEGLKSTANAKTVQDPWNSDITEEFEKLNLIDADEATKMMSFRTSYIGSLSAKSKRIEDEDTKTALTIAGAKGNLTEQEVVHAFENGEIDSSTVKYLITELIPKGKNNKAVTENSGVVRVASGLKKIIIGNEEAADYKDVRYSLAEQADEMFQMGMLSFAEKNPTASYGDTLKAAHELRKSILEIPEFRADSEPLPDVKATLEEQNKTQDTVGPERATKTFLFRDEADLKAAIAEAAKTNGQTGRLADLAKLYKMTPAELMNAQRSLAAQSATPTKK